VSTAELAAAKIRMVRAAAARAGLTVDEWVRRRDLESERIRRINETINDHERLRLALTRFVDARGNRMTWLDGGGCP
jgi:hypothetical protein